MKTVYITHYTGVSTTSSILYYFISVMASNPSIQDEAHNQIIDVIGYRKATIKDRFAIPYVEAMILEILRLMSHVPLGIPHKTRTDVTLHGYEIPKGTTVSPKMNNKSLLNLAGKCQSRSITSDAYSKTKLNSWIFSPHNLHCQNSQTAKLTIRIIAQ